ncbi:MAG: 50S ribosomal protein L32 [Acidimicrobiia bacterium]|nr:50S ribosomal protein L32 [Acidimicrobiia bacterium]
MAVPKKKMSRSRTRRRKANWKAARPNTVTCPDCGGPKLPHRVCPHDGMYNGKPIVDVAE